ncbi:lipoprotein [Natrinema pellirubrum DSM 15624]|uniref:Lipoprotein n=1 Tax=Natrinema pellirubrum (strain DSM 15624 / CIP 106293 / JCM 10476 / NCIMB 786 / 157) TaxID=797303 RepID=L0JQ10_NATP1|nr:nitrous oxide reductase accessory protein NosL [Natrinema pellirubrum]AGB32707.1 NosL [Natrinema pellirubrum DSM 15624]ELY75918.1 lipoprotein [Natrinema pellirubrum DSM 15624]
MTDDGVDRRRFIGALAAGTGVGIAGCLGESESDDGPPAQVYEPTLEGIEEGPFAFPEGESCAVCSMAATEYPESSQLVHENGQAAVFESPGCLFAYVASSTPDSPIAGAWTVDRETGEQIDATEAHYVLITDEEAVDDPMGIDPKAFADREDALNYLEAWEAEDLSPEDDIITGLEPVDLEIAAIYRPHRVPDE